MVGLRTAGIPSSLRRTNERNIVALLLRLGTASRADLAKAAGMSQPTAGKITNQLLELGILQELDLRTARGARAQPETPKPGRPGRMVSLDTQRPRFIAIELGVTQTHVAALPLSVPNGDCWDCTFATSSSAGTWLARLKRAVAALPRRRLSGVLLSVPGIVDEDAGQVIFSPNLHWTERTDLRALVRQVWRAPVLLVQEIRALALGQFAAQPAAEDFLLVDFGQGVGGAIIEGGRLFSSPLPLHGEFGHTPVPGNQRCCGCGAIGCVETLISECGLLESFCASGSGRRRDWKALLAHLGQDELPAWLCATLDSTAAIIAGALNVLGLRHVVVTGTVAAFPRSVTDYFSRAIQQGALWARFGQVTVEVAPRHRAAGLVVVGIDQLLVPAATRRRPSRAAVTLEGNSASLSEAAVAPAAL